MCMHKAGVEKSIMQEKGGKNVQQGGKFEACSFYSVASRMAEIIFACNESFTFHVEIFHALVEVFMLATSLNINIHK